MPLSQASQKDEPWNDRQARRSGLSEAPFAATLAPNAFASEGSSCAMAGEMRKRAGAARPRPAAATKPRRVILMVMSRSSPGACSIVVSLPGETVGADGDDHHEADRDGLPVTRYVEQHEGIAQE